MGGIFGFHPQVPKIKRLGFGIKGENQEKIPSLSNSKIASWVGPTEKEMVITFLNTLKDL
jgi:hypothetical protein